ncbi:hypothetical protein [Nonomuraea rhodomycinica]|uniref:Uncharacterized protein n=1 Tax=Nonomuraea rhodomycinica TaxID=1712872 RepID=A0A7Y6MGM8_9ACTN|nr:hypothetical protein [Nonomuraea rhodomycinica]NUW46054.1 hypothetical protein [Nonomuraea rhodomycinica]
MLDESPDAPTRENPRLDVGSLPVPVDLATAARPRTGIRSGAHRVG